MRLRRQCAGSAAAFLIFLTISPGVFAQSSRIAGNVDHASRASLAGNLHPKARAEYDQGRVSPSMQLSYVTLELAQSASQQADLEKLLVEQQTPGSPNYHHWLTPEQFADRFGMSDGDVAKIAAWLQSEGLTVIGVGRGRTWIEIGRA